MITVDKLNLEFSEIGLFDTKAEWTHPDATVSTYEIIYVTEGQVHICEGDEEYHLERGDMLLLEPDVRHKGCRTSHGRTAFYWLHYKLYGEQSLPLPKLSRPPEADVLSALRELLHLSAVSKRLSDIALAKLLFELIEERRSGNTRAHEIDEFIRVNSSAPLTVSEVAEHFRLSADHIARLLKREFGYDTKTAIVRRRMLYLKSALLNTDMTLKEIAEECGFEDENSLVKFFKYHEKTTPTAFRNKFFHILKNNK